LLVDDLILGCLDFFHILSFSCYAAPHQRGVVGPILLLIAVCGLFLRKLVGLFFQLIRHILKALAVSPPFFLVSIPPPSLLAGLPKEP